MGHSFEKGNSQLGGGGFDGLACYSVWYSSDRRRGGCDALEAKSGLFRVNLIIKRYVEGVIHPVPGKQFGKQWHSSR